MSRIETDGGYSPCGCTQGTCPLSQIVAWLTDHPNETEFRLVRGEHATEHGIADGDMLFASRAARPHGRPVIWSTGEISHAGCEDQHGVDNGDSAAEDGLVTCQRGYGEIPATIVGFYRRT